MQYPVHIVSELTIKVLMSILLSNFSLSSPALYLDDDFSKVP